jgi:hypothetical protein
MDTDGYKDRQQGDLINLLLLFQNEEDRLKVDIKRTGCEIMVCIQIAQ